jgi:hypothetical protein
METKQENLRQGGGGTAIGILLILVGILFFAGQWFNFNISDYGWPFFIIVPGAVLLVAGLITNSRKEEPMLILGSIATTIGLILLFQNATDLWASWAYAWALIPASVGVGQIAHGLLHGNGKTVQTGTRLLTIGLALFAIGAFFFEGIIGINGFGFARSWLITLWPLFLIGAGVLLLGQNLLRGERM